MERERVRREFLDLYMSRISSDKEQGIKDYLRNLIQHSNIEKRRKIFEIAGTHESLKCREWASEYIRNYTLPDHKADFLRMWIQNPYEQLKTAVIEFVNALEVSREIGLRAAIYLLLGEENEAEKIDPGFEILEVLLQSEPLLYAPIAERLTKIRQREFQRAVSDRATVINEVRPEKQVEEIPRNLAILSRSIRTEDWSNTWQIIKDSSFACNAENLSFFKLTAWKPAHKKDLELFLNLVEYIGFDGWSSCSEILQEVITNPNSRYKGVQFEVSQEVLRPPSSLDYWNNELKVEHEYFEGMQKKFINVKSGNFTLLYIIIPTSMNVEIDLTGVAAILNPVYTFTHEEYSWIIKTISRLNKSDDFYERKVLRFFLALEKLAIFQSKRRYSMRISESSLNNIYNEHLDVKRSDLREYSNLFVIGFDFGNTTTAISLIDLKKHTILNGKEILKDFRDPVFHITESGIYLPSLIHYRSGGRKFIGFKAEKFQHFPETFKLMKRSLRRGWSTGIKVEERRIKAPEALKDFFIQIANRLLFTGDQIYKIGFTTPVDAPKQYQIMVQEALSEAFNVPISKIEVFDEATASMIGLKEDIKPNEPTLVIDIGGGTTDLSVLILDGTNPKSQIFARGSDDIGSADIEAIAFYESREKFKTDIPKSPELIIECMHAKHSLVNTGLMEPIVFIKGLNPIKFTIEEINDWLTKEGIREKFLSLIEHCIHQAKNSGSGEIAQTLLTGGGSKWPLFRELMQQLSSDSVFIHDSNIFSVSLGVAKAVLGFSINTVSPYPIGYLRLTKKSAFFEIIIPSGTPIPSSVYELHFQPEELDTFEIELDLRRRRMKMGGENFLLYGKDGLPYMKKGESYTIFEPLQRNTCYLEHGRKYLLWIDNKGYLKIKNIQNGSFEDLGSVL